MDYPNPCFEQLELDIKRTFPGLSQFHTNFASLRSILRTYIK